MQTSKYITLTQFTGHEASSIWLRGEDGVWVGSKATEVPQGSKDQYVQC